VRKKRKKRETHAQSMMKEKKEKKVRIENVLNKGENERDGHKLHILVGVGVLDRQPTKGSTRSR
jgi:hypothetical protein